MKRKFAKQMAQWTKLDDNESIFFARELEHLMTTSYDILYPELKQREVLPVSFEADPADDFITYTQADGVGMATVVSDYATDFKAVEVSGKQFTARVKSLGAAYQYNVQEVRKAAKVGRPLTATKAAIARKAVMQLERDIAFYGDDAYGLQGWFNHPNLPDVALPTGNWATATALQILTDLNTFVNSVTSTSRKVHTPNTLLLPLNWYTKIATTPMSTDNPTMTILNFFMQANPFITSVDFLLDLSAANSGGKLARDIMIVYDRNPMNITLQIPQEFETFPAQEVALTYKVPVHERCGGVIIPYPLSMAKSDDLQAP